jgi:hypothetical protein
MRIAAGTVLALVAAAPAMAAETPRFLLPLDCTLGETCYIQKYVDRDAGPRYADYRCGPLSDDGHKGTDFRLLDFAAMTKGVAVLAAAAGVVGATRDGMPDVSASLVGKDAVTDRGLGNVVTIDHGGGWRTIYAHMRRGSVTRRAGDKVAAGAKLGLVGLSGLSEFPHVHFAVERRGKTVDPFTGPGPRIGCGPVDQTMWHPKLRSRLTYRPTFSLRAGFSTRPMTQAALQYGLYDRTALSRKGGRLYFGILVAGLYKGDTFRFRLEDAMGKTLRDLNGVESQRRGVQFYTAELKRIHRLAPGRYTARFTLNGVRDGRRGIVLEESRTLDLRK